MIYMESYLDVSTGSFLSPSVDLASMGLLSHMASQQQRLWAPQLRRPLGSGGVSLDSSSLGWTVDSWSNSTRGVASSASDV